MSDDGQKDVGEEEQKKVTFSEEKKEDTFVKEETAVTAEEKEEEGPKSNASKTASPKEEQSNASKTESPKEEKYNASKTASPKEEKSNASKTESPKEEEESSSDKFGSNKSNEPDSAKRDEASDVHRNKQADEQPTDTGKHGTAGITKQAVEQPIDTRKHETAGKNNADNIHGRVNGEKDTPERRQSKTSVKEDIKKSPTKPGSVNDVKDTTERRQSKTSVKEDIKKSPTKPGSVNDVKDTPERRQSKTSVKEDIKKSPTKQSDLFFNAKQTADTTIDNTNTSNNIANNKRVEEDKYAFKTDDEKVENTQQSPPPVQNNTESKSGGDSRENVSDDKLSNKGNVAEPQAPEPTRGSSPQPTQDSSPKPTQGNNSQPSRGSISQPRDGTFYMAEEDFVPDDSFESETIPDDDKVSVRTATTTHSKTSFKKDTPKDTTQPPPKDEKPAKRVGISNITINYDTFKSRKPVLLPEQTREKERLDRLQRVMSARESGRYGGLSSRASSRTSSRWSSRPPSRPRTCGYESERRKKEKEFFTAELNRLKDSLRKESKKIKKPKVRDHYPDVFTSLEPYYNTYTANYLINMPDLGYTDEQEKENEEEKEEVIEEEEEAPKDLLLSSRKTAIGLCDPWDSLTMDRSVLPKIETADMRKKRIDQMHTLPKPKSSAGKPKRPEAKQGSTRLPKFPVISLQNQDLATKELIYNDVPMLRDEMSKSFSHSGESRKKVDYNRTRQDFYRMELDRMEDYHSVSRPHMRKAYFAYLQNTPGSRQAVYDCMKELNKKKKESQPQAVA